MLRFKFIGFKNQTSHVDNTFTYIFYIIPTTCAILTSITPIILPARHHQRCRQRIGTRHRPAHWQRLHVESTAKPVHRYRCLTEKENQIQRHEKLHRIQPDAIVYQHPRITALQAFRLAARTSNGQILSDSDTTVARQANLRPLRGRIH